jgi:thiol:disulfide interchange protein
MELQAVAISIAMALSIFYHIDEHNQFAFFCDIFGIIILASTLNLYTIQTPPTHLSALLVFTIIMMLAAIGCWLFATQNDICSESYVHFHTAWHILVSYAITLFIYNSTIPDSRFSSPIAANLLPNHESQIYRYARRFYVEKKIDDYLQRYHDELDDD